MKLLKPLHKITRLMVRNMAYAADNRDPYWLERVGTREVVGYGLNGLPMYYDLHEIPFPAIRWQETNPELQSLYEKAKGDWRLLSKTEKKTLYRASFCQTYSEFQKHRKGDWKEVAGHTLIVCALGIFIFAYYRRFVYDDLPESFKPSRQRAQLRRQIDLKMNPITGLASYWDYDRMDWKTVTWRTPANPFVKCDDDDDD